MAFVTIVSTRYQQDAPASTDLFSDIVNDLNFLNTNQNAPQDINGSPNVVNGSFELDQANGIVNPIGWNFVAGTGGSGSTTNTDQNHGAYSYKVVQPNVGGNTGGVLTGPYSGGNQFMNVSPSYAYQIVFSLKATRADVKNSCVVNWYNSSQAFLSSTTAVSIANGSSPTSWTAFASNILTPPAGAMFMQVIFNLGSDNVTPPGATANIFLDGIFITPYPQLSQAQDFTSTGTFTVPSGVYIIGIKGYGARNSGINTNTVGTQGPVGFGGYVEYFTRVEPGDTVTITIVNDLIGGSSTAVVLGTTLTVKNYQSGAKNPEGTASGGQVNVQGGSLAPNAHFTVVY